MEPGWFRPANFVAHVPLDDVTEEAFLGLEAIFVDDLCRVRDNPRRILGRLMADAKIREPTGRRAAGIDWRGWRTRQDSAATRTSSGPRSGER